MRPIIKQGIVYFYPQGFIDGVNAPAVMEPEDIDLAMRSGPKGLVISLKKVFFFNKIGLTYLHDALLEIAKKYRIETGFCDYSDKHLAQMLLFFGGVPKVNLLQDIKVVQIFFADKLDASVKVLVWNRDKTQRDHLILRLKERGFTPQVPPDEKSYYHKKTQEKFDAIVDRTILSNMGVRVPSRTSGNAIIYTLRGYLDSTIVDVFDPGYHRNSLLVGFKLFIFGADEILSVNNNAVTFFARLAIEAAEYGATICIAGLQEEKIAGRFKEELAASGILFAETLEKALAQKELMEDSGSAAMIKNRKGLTKALVQKISLYVDATVQAIQIMTGLAAIKGEVAIKTLTLPDEEGLLGTVVGFYGDLDGMIVLVFPRQLAVNVSGVLIGDSAKKDPEKVQESLGELVTIIGGRVQAALMQNSLDVQCTLPRTFSSVKALSSVISDRKGVQMEMMFDAESFYFFLTR